MALEKELAESIDAIEEAIELQQTPQARVATQGLGGIVAAIRVIREFCRNWPKIRPVLERIADFLAGRDQEASERALRVVIRFFDTVAKVCPIVP